jgi:excinuclease ABC subunit C
VADSRLREAVSRAPELPGVYRFLDGRGKILYIGKARLLSRRLRGHLSSPGDRRHRSLLRRAVTVDWTVTRSEVEALVLEAELVRLHKPPLNVMLRSDRRYPYLEITTDEDHPRLSINRSVDRSRDIPRFGPYPDVKSLRRLVELLLDAFPLRRCGGAEVTPRERPCLMGQIGRCPAPCVEGGGAGYGENVQAIRRVLEGEWEWASARLEEKMRKAAEGMRFEDAARWRDLRRRLSEFGWPAPESVGDRRPRDIFALQENWGLVMQLRAGRIVGVIRLPFTAGSGGATAAERLEVLLRGYYMETEDVPGRVLVPPEGGSMEVMEEWLSKRRGAAVRVESPSRGSGAELLRLARRDLTDFLRRLEWKRPESQRERISAGLEALADMLGLQAPPGWIVGLDASTVQGSYPVAALVSFRDGVPDKSGYRRFSMPSEVGRNDPAMIASAVGRFLSHLEGESPDLFLVDGGLTQHRAALQAAGGWARSILFVSLAKREETLLVGREERLLRDRPDSPPMSILRSVRDEAHRFVIHYHRQSRSRGALRSQLDDIPGIGPALRALLLKRFGSMRRLAAAPLEEIMEVPGVGRKRAMAVRRYLGDAKGRQEP